MRTILALSFIATLASSVACSGRGSDSIQADSEGGTENEGAFSAELRTRTDAEVKADIEAAAKGAIYMSEGDHPFTFVSAPLPAGTRTITQTMVREKLAAAVDGDPNTDKPLASLYGMSRSWSEWKAETSNCAESTYPPPEECAKVKKLNDALGRNLRGIKVFFFGRNGRAGHVDGVAVSVVIVGRTPQGNLAGVRSIAIWT